MGELSLCPRGTGIYENLLLPMWADGISHSRRPVVLYASGQLGSGASVDCFSPLPTLTTPRGVLA